MCGTLRPDENGGRKSKDNPENEEIVPASATLFLLNGRSKSVERCPRLSRDCDYSLNLRSRIVNSFICVRGLL